MEQPHEAVPSHIGHLLVDPSPPSTRRIDPTRCRRGSSNLPRSQFCILHILRPLLSTEISSHLIHIHLSRTLNLRIHPLLLWKGVWPEELAVYPSLSES